MDGRDASRDANMEDMLKRVMVFSNAVAGRDEEFNDWYDNRHLQDVIAVDGVRSALRYELVEGSPMTRGGPSQHLYLAVYEIEGDLGGIAADMATRREDGRMPVTESYDVSTTVSSVWVPRGPGIVAP